MNLLQIYDKNLDQKQIYMYFELNKNREKCGFEASLYLEIKKGFSKIKKISLKRL